VRGAASIFKKKKGLGALLLLLPETLSVIDEEESGAG
jgi:hypothetical protein